MLENHEKRSITVIQNSTQSWKYMDSNFFAIVYKLVFSIRRYVNP
jgi:hypothetical protein